MGVVVEVFVAIACMVEIIDEGFPWLEGGF